MQRDAVYLATAATTANNTMHHDTIICTEALDGGNVVNIAW